MYILNTVFVRMYPLNSLCMNTSFERRLCEMYPLNTVCVILYSLNRLCMNVSVVRSLCEIVFDNSLSKTVSYQRSLYEKVSFEQFV